MYLKLQAYCGVT